MTKKEGLAVLCCVLTLCLGATSAKQGTPAFPFHVHRTPEKTPEEIDPEAFPVAKLDKHANFAENEPKEIDSEAFHPEYTFPTKLPTHVDFAEYEFQDISSAEQQSQSETDSQRQEDLFTPKSLISDAISPLLTGDQKDTNLRISGRVNKAKQTLSLSDAGVEKKAERQDSARAPGAENKHMDEGTPERTPGQTPAEIPEQMAERIPEQKHERTPAETPERTPEWTPERTPAEIPERTREKKSEVTPEQLDLDVFSRDHTFPRKLENQPHFSGSGFTEHNTQNIPSSKQQSQLGADYQSQEDPPPQNAVIADALSPLLHKDHTDTNEGILVQHDADEQNEYEDSLSVYQQSPPDTNSNNGKLASWQTWPVDETLKHILDKDDKAEETPEHVLNKDGYAEDMLMHVLDKDGNAEEMLLHILDKDGNADETPKHVLDKDDDAEEMLMHILGTDDNTEETPKHVSDKDENAEEMLMHVFDKDNSAGLTPNFPGVGKESKAERSAEQMPEVILEGIDLDAFTPQHTHPDQPVRQTETREYGYMDTFSADQQNHPESDLHIRELSSWQSQLVEKTLSQILSKNGNPEEMARFPVAKEGNHVEQTAEQSAELPSEMAPEQVPRLTSAVAPGQTPERPPDEIDQDVFSPDYALPEKLGKQSDPLDYDVVNIPSVYPTKAKHHQHSSRQTEVAADTELLFLETRKEAEQKTGFKIPKKKDSVSRMNAEQSHEVAPQEIDSKDYDSDKKDSVSRTNAEQSPEVIPGEIDPKDYNTDKKDSVSKTNAEQSPEETPEEIDPQDFPPDYTFPDNPDKHAAEYDEVDVPSTDPQSPDSRDQHHPSTQTELETAGNTTVSWTTNNTTSRRNPEVSTQNASVELKTEEVESTTFHPTEIFPKEPVTQSDSLDYEYEGIIPVHQKTQRGNKARSLNHSTTKNSTVTGNSTRDVRTPVNSTQKLDLPASKTNGSDDHKPEQAPLDPHNFHSNYTSPEKFTNRTVEYGFEDTPSAQKQSQNGTGSQMHELLKKQTELLTENKARVSGEDDNVEHTHEETSEEFDLYSFPADYTFPEELIRTPSAEYESGGIQSSNDKGQPSIHAQSQQNSSTQTANPASGKDDDTEQNLGSQVSGKVNNTENAPLIPANGTTEKAGQNIQKPKENLPYRNQTAQSTMDLSPQSTENAHSDSKRQPQKETMIAGQETLVTTQSPDSKPTQHNVNVLQESRDNAHSNPERQPQEETAIAGQETLVTTQSPDSEPIPHKVEFSADTKDRAVSHQEKQSELAEEDILVTTQSTDSVVHVPTGKPEDNDKDDDALEVSDEDVLRMTNAIVDNVQYDELDVEMTTEYEGRLYRFRRDAMNTTDEGSTPTTPMDGMLSTLSTPSTVCQMAVPLEENCGKEDMTWGYCEQKDSVCAEVAGFPGERICICGHGKIQVNKTHCQEPSNVLFENVFNITLPSDTNSSEIVLDGELSITDGVYHTKSMEIIPANDLLRVVNNDVSGKTFSLMLTGSLPEANEIRSFTIFATVRYPNENVIISDVTQVNIIVRRVFPVDPPVRAVFVVDGTRKGAIVLDLRSELGNIAGLNLSLSSGSSVFALSDHLIVCATDVRLNNFVSGRVVGRTITLTVLNSGEAILILKLAIIANEFRVDMRENELVGSKVADFSQLSGDFGLTLGGDLSTFFRRSNMGDYIELEQLLDYETGQRSFNFRLNFASKDDSDVSSAIPVVVNVIDTNDQAPIPEFSEYSFLVPQNAPPGTIVGLVNFTDPDTEKKQLSLEVEPGVSHYFLHVDSESGALVLRQKLPQNFSDTFYVNASDGVQFSLTSVSIEEYKFFEEIEIRDNAKFENLTEEIGGGVTVTNLSVANYTDYRLQPPSRYFSIDTKTGVVTTTNTTIDRESLTQNPIILSAIAYPEELACNFYVVGNVTITIVDINDNAPIPFQSAYEVTIEEHLPVMSALLTVSASDRDIGENAELRYALLGPDSNSFSIDRFNGTITVRNSTALDRETKDSLYLTVTVTDGGDNPTVAKNTAITSVNVTLSDINDNNPVFTTSSYSVRIVENDANPLLPSFTATDRDEGVNSKIRYQLTGGRGFFALNSTTGELRLVDRVNREQYQSFMLTVLAFDEGSPPRSASASVSITVEDVNDVKPRFEKSDYFLENQLDEGDCSCLSSPLWTVQANDTDNGINGTVIYSIDSTLLRINRQTGQIFCVTCFDYENVTHREIAALVTATDGGTPALQDLATVHVSLQDVNDNDPKFENASYYFVTPSQKGRLVGIVRAMDVDSGNNARLNYTVTSNTPGGSGLLDISSDGVLTLTKENSVVIVQRVYSMTLTATDKGQPPRSGTATLTLNVTAAGSDATDLLNNSTYNFYLEENTGDVEISIGRPEKKNPNSQVDFRIEDVFPDDYRPFYRVENATGEIFLNRSVDREQVSKFNVYVRARSSSGGSNEQFALAYVNVLDINDNTPRFTEDTSTPITVEIAENTANGTLVRVLRATDPDFEANGTVIYSLNDTRTFYIDSSGNIIVANEKNLDRESNDTFILLVTVQDNATIPRSNSSTVVITLSDVNDEIPAFNTSIPKCFELQENAPQATTVGRVEARDRDLPLNSLRGFDVLNQNSCPCDVELVDQGDVFVGELRLHGNQTLDYDHEGSKEFVCLISAVDTGGQSSELNVTICLTDINDNPPKFDDFNTEVNISRDAEVDASILNVTATDIDSGRNAELVYELFSDDSVTYFEIDPVSGEITVNQSLQGAQVEKTHLTVTVTDNGTPPLNASVVITVTLSDNNTAPSLNQAGYDINVTEEELVLTSPPNVTAVDFERGRRTTCNCNFTIADYPGSGGSFTEYFNVDRETGLISLEKAIDRETTGDKILGYLVVTDAGLPPKSFSATVTVHVEDKDDNVPTFNPNFVSIDFTVSESTCKPGSIIFTLNATDEDKYPNNRFVYGLSNESPGSKYVEVNSTSGDVSLSSGNLCSEEPGTTTFISFTATAVSDGKASPLTLYISLRENNTNTAPKFSKSSYQASLPFNTEVGNVVAVEDFIATDADNDSLRYVVEKEDCRGALELNDTTRILTLKYAVDEGRKACNLTVIATDDTSHSANPRFAETATATILVTIEDKEPTTAGPEQKCFDGGRAEELQSQADQFILFRALFIALVVLSAIAIVAAVVFFYKWRVTNADFAVERARSSSVAHSLFRPHQQDSHGERSAPRSADTTGLPPRLPRLRPDQRRDHSGGGASGQHSGQSRLDEQDYLVPSTTSGGPSDQNISWSPNEAKGLGLDQPHDYLDVLPGQEGEGGGVRASNPYTPLRASRGPQSDPYLHAIAPGHVDRPSDDYLHATSEPAHSAPRGSSAYIHPTDVPSQRPGVHTSDPAPRGSSAYIHPTDVTSQRLGPPGSAPRGSAAYIHPTEVPSQRPGVHQSDPVPRGSSAYIHPTEVASRAPDHGSSSYLPPGRDAPQQRSHFQPRKDSLQEMPPPPRHNLSFDMPSPYSPGDPAVYRARQRSPSMTSSHGGSQLDVFGPTFSGNVAAPYGLRPTGRDPTGFTNRDDASRI